MVALLRVNKLSGWRRHLPIEGKPDFVWSKQRVVLFVDGCFWHGCPKCRQKPVNNAEYWEWKITRNRKRDRLVSRHLKADGWIVVRLWECSMSDKRSLNRLRTALDL